tara:strand:- start:40 stop:777 length:738 start_codon:yes stop_codon:yes gene_type:complete
MPKRTERDESPPDAEDETASKGPTLRGRKVAKHRGYRHIATRSGYSATIPSADAARDVTANILSVNEVIRACKWAPRLPKTTSYGSNIDEYADRLQLAMEESLPPGSASEIRASVEVFARRAMNDAVQRAFDAGVSRVSTNLMMSALRPVAPSLRYTFMAPMGLVRHAQTTLIGPEDAQSPALAASPTDEATLKTEASTIRAQVALSNKKKGEAEERKVKRKARREELQKQREAEAKAAGGAKTA